jgi:hypothetical protein
MLYVTVSFAGLNTGIGPQWWAMWAQPALKFNDWDLYDPDLNEQWLTNFKKEVLNV